MLAPCIPRDWKGFEIAYRHHSATYQIVVENPRGVEHGVSIVTLDGKACEDGSIHLIDDGGAHEVRVVLGPEA